MSTVSKRYALALFQLAQEQNLIDTIESELRAVKQAITDTPELLALLKNPRLSLEKKKELVKQIFTDCTPFVQHTLMLLVDRHRENEIVNMASDFVALTNEAKGTAEATVQSVRPLTTDEADGISNAFAPKVGKKTLEITNEVDTDLLGGLKIRIGNIIFDGSLQGKLERLKRELIS
ncbi:MAG TPA: F0F1 ATP synthase subunit delta [Bacillus sp. (in: firmicutes)]|uniref:F0F1 ATP synthase subunit delta n=1 Tax=Bacillus litorisediminis TaxID=2922713 RepID=UPI001FAD6512|nr:F0F1 ATP synthase subunit delta [Bacillus litorisediminis]HWO78104.1 F0F1 ATP synthase subunit delta [Bacillus sp. (in: firmicutes)]